MSLDYIFHGSPTSKKATGGTVALAIDVTAGKLYYRDDSAVDDEVGFQPISAGSSVSIDGVLVSNPNFNDTTPAAPAGNTNVIWQLNGNNVSAYTPTAIPGGSNTDIQFNDGGVFGGAAGITWDKANNLMLVGNTTQAGMDPAFEPQGSLFTVLNNCGSNNGSGPTGYAQGYAITGWAQSTNPSVNNVSIVGLYGLGEVIKTSAGSYGNINIGPQGAQLDGISSPSAGATIVSCKGAQCIAIHNGAGTTSFMIAIEAHGPVILGGGTVNEAIGIHVGAQVGATTNYGLAIDGSYAGANDFAIAVNSITARSFFGVINFGGTALVADTGISRSAAGTVAIGNGTAADFSGTLKTTIVNAVTGYQNNSTTPTAGHVLRSNGTVFVDAQLQYGDIGGTVPTPPSGSVLWSALGNAAADLTLANAGFKTTFNQTSAVPWAWANTTAATSAGTVATIALVASGVTTLLSQATNSVTLNTTGATLLVVLANSYNGYATITDSFGNTWTKASTVGETPGVSAVAIYYAYSGASGGSLITGANHAINVTSSNYNGGSVYAFSGTDTTSAVLGTATAAGATNLSTPIVSCTITPVTGDLLINGFGVNQTATAPTFSANGDGNTWSSPLGNGSAATTQAFWAAYTVAASATASNPKWTRAGVTAANQVMVSFKPSVVSVPQSSPILTLAGTYYGSGSAADSWTVQTVEGALVNGPSTLTFSHSGSSGFAAISMPNLTVTGQLTAAALYIPGTGYLGALQAGTATANQIITTSGAVSAPAISVGGGGAAPGLYNAGNGLNVSGIALNLFSGSTYYAQISSTNLSLISGVALGWSSSSTSVNTASDSGISRIGAASLAIGNGTAGDFTGALKLGTVTLTAAAPTVAASQVGLGSTTSSTVGAAGGASALPATPTGYLVINVAGTAYKVPYYAS